MRMLAWIFGTIGGLCMVAGITTALEVLPQFGAELTWMFWMVLSAVLLLISIAFAISRIVGYD